MSPGLLRGLTLPSRTLHPARAAITFYVAMPQRFFEQNR
jgi:hypothetical protein